MGLRVELRPQAGAPHTGDPRWKICLRQLTDGQRAASDLLKLSNSFCCDGGTKIKVKSGA